MVEFSYTRRSKQLDVGRTQTHILPERARVNPATTSPGTGLNRKVCFSFAAYACTVISHLSKCNVPISKGLSEEEFEHIQLKFGFEFPPDLRSILQEGLPVGVGFPNWRSSSDKQLLSMINSPAKGLCHEVSKGTFWCNHWGPRPDRTDDAIRIARMAFKMAPVLVPIYSYCYIPCFPDLSGNPIFFVFEKDVFYCGYDLADFFEREVFIPLRSLSKSFKRPECDETGLRPQRGSGRERQKNMSSINEDMVMESKLREYYDKDDGLLHHTHGGQHHSQYQNAHWQNLDHDQYARQHHSQHQKAHWQNLGGIYDPYCCDDHRRHAHHRSSKEVNWEILNQRLCTELRNVDSKDEWLHGKEGNEYGIRHSEVSSRKSLSEEPLRSFECAPESLVRSAGNSPRMGQSIMSRYAYFHEKPLPAKVLSQFTIAAPPWAAKMARHIPMWSDLVENNENLPDANVARLQELNTKLAPHTKGNMLMQSDVEGKESVRLNGVLMQEFKFKTELPEYVKSQGELRNYAGSRGELREYAKSQGECREYPKSRGEHREYVKSGGEQRQYAMSQEEQRECVNIRGEQGSQISGDKPMSKRWLVPYFTDMEKRLRRGGWKEDEIEEMMVAVLSPNNEIFAAKQTRRAIQDVLDTSTNAMSFSLRKAGWSVPDVSDILSLHWRHPDGMHTGNMVSSADANCNSNLTTEKKVAGKLCDFLTAI